MTVGLTSIMMLADLAYLAVAVVLSVRWIRRRAWLKIAALVLGFVMICALELYALGLIIAAM